MTLATLKCDMQDLVHKWAGDDHLDEFCDVLDAIIAQAKLEEQERIAFKFIDRGRDRFFLPGEVVLAKWDDKTLYALRRASEIRSAFT